MRIGSNQRLNLGMWSALVALAALVVVYVLVWHVWHGWVNFDTLVQWRQVQSGEYTQWHPFAHTFLLMKVPSLIWNDYRVSIIWQIVWFAASFGYLAYALQRADVSFRWALICLGVTLLHPQTLFFVMTPLKDTAFAIAVLLAIAALIQVVCEGGVALKRKSVWIPLSLGLTLASLFRHNGIFFSVPALVLLIVFCGRAAKRVLFNIILACAALMFVFKYAAPRLYDVKPASAYPVKYQFIESCGLPLSMMGAVYMKNPDAVPPKARELLESIAPREVWFSWANWSFNSIKHHGTSQLSDERIAGYKFAGWMDFANTFMDTVKVDPNVAIGEGLRLTGQVWNPAGLPRNQFWFPLKKLGFDDARIKQLMPLLYVLSIPLVGVVGLTVWACFALSVWACRTKCLPFLLLTLPILAYDLGTMCFLSGYAAYRFFFANILVLLPILLIFVKLFGVMKGKNDDNVAKSGMGFNAEVGVVGSRRPRRTDTLVRSFGDDSENRSVNQFCARPKAVRAQIFTLHS